MNKVEELIKNINLFITKVDNDDDITDGVPDFPGLDKIPALVEDFETVIASLLRRQRKWIIDEFNAFVSKDDKIVIEAFLSYLKNDLFAADDFANDFGDEAANFLQSTVEELAKAMMESIDDDIPFEMMSKRTTDWIKRWSKDLADIMQLHTHEALEKELLDVIEQGESIAQAELRMKDMPQFDRKRARATARTEILTASSQAHYESFMQSPSVVGKKWKHSGAKKNNPRETHMAMDGVVVGVDEYFLVDGEEGLYPRDPAFSAKNRVNCGCAMGPDVDEKITGLSKEEKEAIRQEVLDEMNS
jgi:hypothetical protein